MIQLHYVLSEILKSWARTSFQNAQLKALKLDRKDALIEKLKNTIKALETPDIKRTKEGLAWLIIGLCTLNIHTYISIIRNKQDESYLILAIPQTILILIYLLCYFRCTQTIKTIERANKALLQTLTPEKIKIVEELPNPQIKLLEYPATLFTLIHSIEKLGYTGKVAKTDLSNNISSFFRKTDDSLISKHIRKNITKIRSKTSVRCLIGVLNSTTIVKEYYELDRGKLKGQTDLLISPEIMLKLLISLNGHLYKTDNIEELIQFMYQSFRIPKGVSRRNLPKSTKEMIREISDYIKSHQEHKHLTI
jgi:hypothetical protein